MAQENPSYTLQVLVGGSTSSEEAVPVCVTRKCVRNLNLRVQTGGSVVLSVPWHVSRERAQAFLNAHAAWIARTRRRVLARTEAAARNEGCAGGYALWGELRRSPDGSTVSAEELDELYRAEMTRALPEVIERMEPLVGAHASGWQVRVMKSRWGSCTPKTGRIRINARLAAYPPECIGYVVAHELAHLLEPSHSQRFHAIVARAIPNEREIRARLRQPPALG